MKPGRPKTFDEDEALARVMQTFWKNGFEASTYEQLVDDSGLSRSSLYNTFGGKEALFTLAIRRYIKQQFARIPEGLNQTETGAEKLLQFVNGGIVGRYDPNSKDCLLRKTVLANAGAAEPPRETKQIRGYLRTLWKALTTAISNLKTNKPIQFSEEERGALILATFFGAAAISRNAGDAQLQKTLAEAARKLARE